MVLETQSINNTKLIQFNDKESWNSYLDNFSMKLNNPLKIEIIL